ncbi:hypothetical protein [Nonomuraea turcica]|uniref:hypothetical protein n=1 Tax=Nonomuraea sp. G32 TaxID=3067274 RepID=UPI00273AB88D|nr:hypothetical protein [Nonomuraea sp. G32]MDP4510333.1 hypothetical protein [Nonomuraea sp. G32]
MTVSQVRLHAEQDGRRYDLTVQAVDGGHQVELIGSDADGQLLAEWRGTLPAATDLTAIAQLLSCGVAELTGTPAPRPATTVEQQRAKHANAARPWSADDDVRLAELAASPEVTIEDLMRELGRSRGAVRSRLEKKVPGSPLLLRRAPAVTP